MPRRPNGLSGASSGPDGRPAARRSLCPADFHRRLMVWAARSFYWRSRGFLYKIRLDLLRSCRGRKALVHQVHQFVVCLSVLYHASLISSGTDSSESPMGLASLGSLVISLRSRVGSDTPGDPVLSGQSKVSTPVQSQPKVDNGLQN